MKNRDYIIKNLKNIKQDLENVYDSLYCKDYTDKLKDTINQCIIDLDFYISQIKLLF
jgi:hypothetical protein